MRLDSELVRRGLAATRSRARDLVLRGHVLVNGRPVERPAATIGEADTIALGPDAPGYVSRGAEKLAAAIEAFAFPVAGRVALDVGASTGGFTEVLLAFGASRVYAVDVGHGQLHPTIAADPRVVALEGTDARSLTVEHIPEPFSAIAADVSFISLAKALPAVLAMAAPGAWLIALVKPQFEAAGPSEIGKGGIVRCEATRLAAVDGVVAWLDGLPGWHVTGRIVSPITGGSGNVEYLVGARRDA